MPCMLMSPVWQELERNIFIFFNIFNCIACQSICCLDPVAYRLMIRHINVVRLYVCVPNTINVLL